MRWLVLVALVACGDKFPTPPDRAEYEKLDAEQRCEATAPRGMLCVDELMIASLVELGGPELAKEAEASIRAAGKSGSAEAREIHRHNCRGNLDPMQYPDAVMRCWAIEDCRAFAACVMKPEPKTPGKP